MASNSKMGHEYFKMQTPKPSQELGVGVGGGAVRGYEKGSFSVYSERELVSPMGQC